MSEYSERDENEPDYDIYEGPHVCREAIFCTCAPAHQFVSYAQDCPIHGLGPPRCCECGRFMPRKEPARSL